MENTPVPSAEEQAAPVAEQTPTENKPATEQTPAENKPITEQAPAEKKPVPDKTPAEKKPKKKKKGRVLRTILKIIIWIVVIAGVAFLTLFLTSRIAEFESIPAMLQYIRDQLS